jgi:hypothetical protein
VSSSDTEENPEVRVLDHLRGFMSFNYASSIIVGLNTRCLWTTVGPIIARSCGTIRGDIQSGDSLKRATNPVKAFPEEQRQPYKSLGSHTNLEQPYKPGEAITWYKPGEAGKAPCQAKRPL